MVYPETFSGFRVKDHKNWSTFEKQDFEPKKFDQNDIDVRIEACGVCGSDGEWLGQLLFGMLQFETMDILADHFQFIPSLAVGAKYLFHCASVTKLSARRSRLAQL